MIDDRSIELFVLKCSVIQAGLRSAINSHESIGLGPISGDPEIRPYIRQFDIENRDNAARMSRYYAIFYMLENDISKLINETLELAHGSEWWDTHVPQAVQEEVRKNQENEMKAGISNRSEREIDYTTFGQLGDIIRSNWADFAGMLSNQSAVSRVLFGLNLLRGTIAHCGVLAEDEVGRLKLAIADWFRILEGPR